MRLSRRVEKLKRIYLLLRLNEQGLLLIWILIFFHYVYIILTIIKFKKVIATDYGVLGSHLGSCEFWGSHIFGG